MCLGVAKFISEYCKFRKMRVGGDELSLGANILDNTVDWVIITFLILIEDVSMSVTEGTSLNILTRDSNMEPFLNESSESKCLSSTPIDSLFIRDGFGPLLENLSDESMEVFVCWQVGNLHTDVLESLIINTAELALSLIALSDLFPVLCHPIFGLVFECLTLDVGFLHLSVDLFLHSCDLLWVGASLFEQEVLVDTGNWGHLGDLFVHEWLCETWLIELVVTHLSVTDQVDDDVMFIYLTILCGNLENIVDVFHAVGIDVEDWGVNGLGEIGSVHSTSTLDWNGSETDLIVDNDVNRTTNRVIVQVLHLHGFINHALSGEGCVTMDQEWYNFVTPLGIIVFISNVVLSSASSHNDWVDALQVRRVGKDLDSEFIAIWIGSSVTCSQVVFDITGGSCPVLTVNFFRQDTLELGEDGLEWLSDDVGEQVETTSVRHTNNCLLGTQLCDGVESRLHTWDE